MNITTNCTPERLLEALQADEAPLALTNRMVKAYREALEHLDQSKISELQLALYEPLVRAGHHFAALAIFTRQDEPSQSGFFHTNFKENQHGQSA